MMYLIGRAVRFLTVMSVFTAWAGVASAAGVILNNEMERDIKAVYCVDDDGTTQEVTGALKAGASITVVPDKFPEYECNRIAVQTSDGSAWQYYQEPEPGAASEIAFSMDKANPNAETSYPALLVTSGDEPYLSPAGVPLDTLTQLMGYGLVEDKWKAAAAPNADKTEDPGAFAISFAGVSWSLVGDGLVFAEIITGLPPIAESANMVSSFSNSTIMAMFDGLRSVGAKPWAISFRHTEVAFTSNGKEQLPDAELQANPDAEDSHWETINGILGIAADSASDGPLRIVLGSDALMFDLILDLEDGSATLTITRRPGAALG